MADTNDLLLEGTLEIKLRNQATPQGWVAIPGIAKLEVTHKADIIDAPPSKDRGHYGEVTASAAKPKPIELKLSLSRTIGKAFPMGLMGTQAGASQSAGSLTAQAVTAILGQGVDLGKRGFTPGTVVVKNSAGTTTYVEGTDYTFNYRLGTLYALAGGAIADAAALKVDGAYAGLAWNKLSAGQVAKWDCELRLDGKNLFDGRDLDIDIPAAMLTPDSAVDFMSDKPVDLGFTGRIVVLPGQDPYTVNHGIAATA